jgi:hypothetical protein
MKVLYNVTLKVDNAIHDEWYHWMINVHIPEVLATKKFLSHRMMKILGDDDHDGITYAVQYTCIDINTYLEYQKIHAQSLQLKTKLKYGDNLLAFRTLMEIHDES